jgi:hypothetical protein
MPDFYVFQQDYEIRELRDGVAVLRNVETGAEIERRVVVNLNTGTLRVATDSKAEAR